MSSALRHPRLKDGWVLKILIFLSAKFLVHCDVYETIYWSPENPKFLFTKEQFQNGKAYFDMAVNPMSDFNLLCPNLDIVARHMKSSIAKEALFENLWMVDKEDFTRCAVDTTKKENNLLHKCAKPLELQFYGLTFRRQSSTGNDIEIAEGKNYYFIATSDGTKSSLNNTSGGHCNDTKNGVAMRLLVYVCFTNFSDPKCHPLNESRNGEEEKQDPYNVTVHTVLKYHYDGSQDIWQKLAITFMVALAVSFLLISILVVCLCRRKNIYNPSCDSSKCEEPLNSIPGESKKTSKTYGRVSAAL